MPSSAKAKGNAYERELVKKAQDAGFEAERAYASNGEAIGQHETVDNGFYYGGEAWYVNAKRRSSFPDYVTKRYGSDVLLLNERTSGECWALFPLQLFFSVVKGEADVSELNIKEHELHSVNNVLLPSEHNFAHVVRQDFDAKNDIMITRAQDFVDLINKYG